MGTITVFSVWATPTLKQRSWVAHVLIVKKNMTIGTLRSQLSHFFKRLKASSVVSHLDPSTHRYEALGVSTEGNMGSKMAVLSLGKFPRASHCPACSVPPVEFLDELGSSPMGELNFSFARSDQS